jgi:Cu+-exporting ATPase
VDAIVFDKTGTLTLGAPQLSDTVVASGASEQRLLEAAATVEAQSEHPLALAIVRGARERGASPRSVEDFGVTPGRGVYALAGGRAIAAGSAAMLEEYGVTEAPLAAERTRLERAGRTVVGVAEAASCSACSGSRTRCDPRPPAWCARSSGAVSKSG